MNRTVFAPGNGRRLGFANPVVVVVTDGQATSGDPKPIADLIKANYLATIFSVGVGSINRTELNNMASDPDSTCSAQSQKRKKK